MDNIDLSQTVALNYENKKELKKLNAIKYRPEGRSSKAKLIVPKATNHNNIESGVTKSTNHGKEKDSSKGQSKEEKNSGLSYKDQTFGRSGGITFNEDSNTYHNNSKIRSSAGECRSGGRGCGQGGQGRRGRGLRTMTIGKNDIKNNIITVATGTSTKSQSGGIGNDRDMKMGGTGGGEDDDIVDGTGDRNSKEEKERKEERGEDNNHDKNNPTNTRVQIVDPKDMIHKKIHNLSSFVNIS